MTPSEALADVRGYARAGQVRVTFHAKTRMAERGVAAGDLWHALENAERCRAESEERWRVEGPDEEGATLTAIVVIVDGVLVVTVF